MLLQSFKKIAVSENPKEDAPERTGKSDAEGGPGIFGGLMDSLGGLATKLARGGVGLAVILGGIGLVLGALAAIHSVAASRTISNRSPACRNRCCGRWHIRVNR